MTCTWKSEYHFWALVLAFYHVGPGIEFSLPCFAASPFTHFTISPAFRFLPSASVLCRKEVIAAGKGGFRVGGSRSPEPLVRSQHCLMCVY